jgi:hypothetical protein
MMVSTIRIMSIAGAGILTLGLITATPDPCDGPAVRVVSVTLVAFTDQAATTPRHRPASASAGNTHGSVSSQPVDFYEVGDFVNSLPEPIPELFHSVLAIGLFFVFLPAFWVAIRVISAANVVLNAFGLPLLPNVLNPPFGPSPQTSAKATPRLSLPALRTGTGRADRLVSITKSTAPKRTTSSTRTVLKSTGAQKHSQASSRRLTTTEKRASPSLHHPDPAGES